MDPVGDYDGTVDPLDFSIFPGSTVKEEPPVTPKRPPSPPLPQPAPSPPPQTPPPAPPSPVHTPEQDKTESLKRQLSPASDILSPEHVRSRGNPLPRPKPKAPEFQAQPMSSFRPPRRHEGYGDRFQSFPHYEVPPSAQQPAPAGPSTLRPPPEINFQPQQRRMGQSFAPRPEQAAQDDSDEDMHMRSSSPDPLDFLNQAEVEQDVHVTEALLGLAEHEQYYSLEDALQYAFEAKEKRLPSEPIQ